MRKEKTIAMQTKLILFLIVLVPFFSVTAQNSTNCEVIKANIVTLLNKALEKGFSDNITLDNVQISDIQELYDFYNPPAGTEINPLFRIDDDGKSFVFELKFSSGAYGVLLINGLSGSLSNASSFVKKFISMRFIAEKKDSDQYDIALKYETKEGEIVTLTGTLENIRGDVFGCEDGPDDGDDGGGDDDCNTCYSFKPKAGKYIVSAWVKEVGDAEAVQYSQNSKIRMTFLSVAGTNTTPPKEFTINKKEYNSIDGWQRIYGEFLIPEETNEIKIALINANTTNIKTYFDDIRIHPYNGSMKSFVYDPVTQRLMAELDDNNYSTFYEYDQEGGLVRVKKETEKGIYTIQETRSNSPKTDPLESSPIIDLENE